jgi:beta-N-acetylhexosaminidase
MAVRLRFPAIALLVALTSGLAGCQAGAPSTTPTSSAASSGSPTTAPPATLTPPGSTSPTPLPPLRQRIAALIVVGFRGAELTADDPVVALLRDEKVGGVILFDRDMTTGEPRNVVSPEQLQRLTAQLRAAAGDRPLIIAVDQEGGRVARLGPQNGFAATPSATELGAAGDTAATRASAARTGHTLAGMGITLDLAPVVDVNVNPDNPSIGLLERSFSSDAAVVTEQAAAFIDGLHDAGVWAAIKHFPGLGSATGDTDRGLVDISATWRRREEAPFRELIARGLPDVVMVANAVDGRIDPDLPASLSAATLRELRLSLGWAGLVITDDLQAGAIVDGWSERDALRLALNAGADLLLLANQQHYSPDTALRAIDAIEEMVSTGEISRSTIDAAYLRVTARLAEAPPR